MVDALMLCMMTSQVMNGNDGTPCIVDALMAPLLLLL
jgi:hypothetical protein